MVGHIYIAIFICTIVIKVMTYKNSKLDWKTIDNMLSSRNLIFCKNWTISFRNIFHNRSPRNQHCIFICVPVLRVETGDLHSRWIKNQTDFGILSKNIGSLSPRCSAIPINQSLAHICTKSLLRSNEIHATTLSPFTIRIANKLSYFSQFFSHIDDHKFINFDFK